MADQKSDRVRVDVDVPTYQGVSIDHPSIRSAIRNMAKDGKTLKEIMRVVGMPADVVRRHAPTVKEA